jgi:hypothetical protein
MSAMQTNAANPVHSEAVIKAEQLLGKQMTPDLSFRSSLKRGAFSRYENDALVVFKRNLQIIG